MPVRSDRLSSISINNNREVVLVRSGHLSSMCIDNSSNNSHNRVVVHNGHLFNISSNRVIITKEVAEGGPLNPSSKVVVEDMVGVVEAAPSMVECHLIIMNIIKVEGLSPEGVHHSNNDMAVAVDLLMVDTQDHQLPSCTKLHKLRYSLGLQLIIPCHHMHHPQERCMVKLPAHHLEHPTLALYR